VSAEPFRASAATLNGAAAIAKVWMDFFTMQG
jgi:hypothetical protein